MNYPPPARRRRVGSSRVRLIGQDYDWGDFFDTGDIGIPEGGITGGLDVSPVDAFPGEYALPGDTGGGLDFGFPGEYALPGDTGGQGVLEGEFALPGDTGGGASFWDSVFGTGVERVGGQVLTQGRGVLLRSIFGTGGGGGGGTGTGTGTVPTPGRPGYVTLPDGTIRPATAPAAAMPSWMVPALVGAAVLLLMKRR